MVNHCRLLNLFTWEDTPCNCIYFIFAAVFYFFICEINRLECQARIFFQFFSQFMDQLCWAEKLIVRFLKNIASRWPPSVNFICAWNTVNSWLRICSQKSIYVHFKQDILNDFRFSFNWGNSLYPWQMLNFSLNKTNKYSTNIFKSTRRDTPFLFNLIKELF